ncbi:MAG TPA: hypothetical protein VMD29_05635 [Terracidiphilus sp.]|nr:hypothetical protein [Terracidiphilus sp.]
MADDSALATALARLWPHREHESGLVRGLLCRLRMHGWRRLDLRDIAPSRDVRFCFWCSKIKIDGVIHEHDHRSAPLTPDH